MPIDRFTTSQRLEATLFGGVANNLQNEVAIGGGLHGAGATIETIGKHALASAAFASRPDDRLCAGAAGWGSWSG